MPKNELDNIISIMDQKSKAAPSIRIAPSAQEKQQIKDFEAECRVLSDEQTDEFGNIVSKRHEDLFIGGPYDKWTCNHQPNGPRGHDDPKGLNADYFIKDKMHVEGSFGHVTGYHIYSTAKGIYEADGVATYRPEHRTSFHLQYRGPSMRKCYYYCGFVDERILWTLGFTPQDFHGVLSVGI